MVSVDATKEVELDGSRVLIVDDNPANVGVLFRYLDRQRFEVRVAQDATGALRIASDEVPDIILLDIMLPDLDGYEACRRLKESERTRDIPVIFISALADLDDKVAGFEAGGVDYITKPFQHEEVLARVRTHLLLLAQRRRLHELNAMKDRFFSIIAHDLRGPFNGFRNAAELIRDAAADDDRDTVRTVAETLVRSASTTQELLEDLLEWARSQRGAVTYAPGVHNVAMLVQDAVSVFRDVAQVKGVDLASETPAGLFVHSDYETTRVVLRNLVNNAVKFTPSGGAVLVRGYNEGNWAVVEVTDTGVGMDDKTRAKLFRMDQHIVSKGTGGERGSGLGLLLVADYVRGNGGTIEVSSTPGLGSSFTVRLPVAGDEEG